MLREPSVAHNVALAACAWLSQGMGLPLLRTSRTCRLPVASRRDTPAAGARATTIISSMQKHYGKRLLSPCAVNKNRPIASAWVGEFSLRERCNSGGGLLACKAPKTATQGCRRRMIRILQSRCGIATAHRVVGPQPANDATEHGPMRGQVYRARAAPYVDNGRLRNADTSLNFPRARPRE